MEKPEFFPEKIFMQLLDAHHDMERPFKADYYLVIDLSTNLPQAVDVHKFLSDSLASFHDALQEPGECSPVAILDREAALWIVGQSAISFTEETKNSVFPEGKQPIYQLLPVFFAGASTPVSKTKTIWK